MTRVTISTYDNKPRDYFREVRYDITTMIVGDNLSILDIGCGSGATGEYLLQSGKAASVSGVEIVPEQAALAAKVLDDVVIGDVSTLELPWSAESFDCILAGDVLEHLADPWTVLQRIRPLLRRNGSLVASIPNVRFWPVVSELIWQGEWRYRESGVLDGTHLRFFTKRSMQRMLLDTGFCVDVITPFFWGPKTTGFNQLTLGAFEEFLAQRWLVRCSLPAAP